VIAEKEMFE